MLSMTDNLILGDEKIISTSENHFLVPPKNNVIVRSLSYYFVS